MSFSATLPRPPSQLLTPANTRKFLLLCHTLLARFSFNAAAWFCFAEAAFIFGEVGCVCVRQRKGFVPVSENCKREICCRWWYPMAEAKVSEVKNVRELLFTDGRDYLLDKAGREIKFEGIEGKVVGIVIGPHWLPIPLEHAISVISEPYEELKKNQKDVVFVYVAADRDTELIETLKKYGQTGQLDERPDVECFNDFLQKMPEGWLAVPFEDSLSRANLISLYRSGIFSLAFVGADGHTHTKDGLRILEKWGAEGYPYSDERMQELQHQAAERAANQSLKSLLVHEERDYVIANDGRQVKVTELEGKTVALYFSAHWCPPCQKFTPVLAGIYNELKEKQENFEIVFISSDEDQTSFENYFKGMPWLAVPFSDLKTKKTLNHLFEVEGIPTLIILDTQGKTMQAEGMEVVYKYGVKAYPFTNERLAFLQQEEAAIRASQTLENLLVSDERDFLISHDDQQVKVSSLTGKTVGLYFSAHWCPPCRKFTPKLISVYNKLKSHGEQFEVVFLSSDRDEEAFKEYYASMPWLALPYQDKSKRHLSQYFDVQGIPQLVIVGPDGKTITHGGRGLITLHGDRAFPFTDARLAELQKEIDVEAEKLPKEITTDGHEHCLQLTPNAYEGPYVCDGCDEQGSGWVYHCAECGYDLHPACAEATHTTDAKSQLEDKGGEQKSEEIQPNYVCDGEVCRKI